MPSLQVFLEITFLVDDKFEKQKHFDFILHHDCGHAGLRHDHPGHALLC